MSEAGVSPEEDRKAWLRRLANEFLKLEALFPITSFLPDEGLPPWVEKVEQEIGATMFPVARIKDDLNLTPNRMGALIGHSCAIAVWMIEALQFEIERAPELDESKFTAEQLEHGAKIFYGIVNDWYPAFRRLAKRALCTSVDRTYDEMTEFLLAYSAGFSRKPKKFGMPDVGHSAMEIYFFMLMYWRGVNALGSVRQLHEVLVNRFGPYRVGELKRIEKICQRIGLHYRKPGRPKEK